MSSGNGKTRPDPDCTGLESDKRKPEVFDGKTGLPDAPPASSCAKPEQRRIDLSTLRDVRLELAAVYRQMDAGTIEGAEGTKRAYVLKTIAEVIETSELEKRLRDLEDRQAGTGALSGQRALPERTLN